MKFKSISKVALAALALCAGASQAVTIELTTNGNFNTGTLAGWQTYPGGDQFVGSDGPGHESVAILSATGSAASTVIKQANLGLGQLTPGQTVHVEFDARGFFPPGAGSVFFVSVFSEFGVPGASLDLKGPFFPQSWQHFSFDSVLGPVVLGGMSLEMKIANGADAMVTDKAQLWLDNVSVTANVAAIPEPETYALMLAGLVGVGAMVRRRRAI